MAKEKLDIDKVIKDAAKNKSILVFRFSEKPTGVYKVQFGITLFGKSFYWTKKI